MVNGTAAVPSRGTTLSRRRFLAAAAALATPPLLAGCAGATPGGGGAGGTTLRVGVLPIVGAAPLTLAVEEGLFAAAGLTVSLEPVQSGAIALPALVAGDLDILFGNHVSTIAARAQRLDVVIIAEASRAQPGNFAVVALPDSAVSRPAELAGRTIGVNALNNIATLTVSAVLRAAGVAPQEVTFVEIPFPELADALGNRRVDAVFLAEPFLTGARRTLDVATIVDPCSGPTEGLPIDGYVTTGCSNRCW